MRRIGTLEETTQAERFCDYLTTLAIDAAFEPGDGAADIWIRNETDVDRAREELERFRTQPADPRYDAKQKAAKIRQQQIDDDARRIKQQKKLERSVPRGGAGAAMLGGAARQQRIPLTIGVIVISVIVSFLTNFGQPVLSRDGKTLTFEAEVYLALSFVDRREYERLPGDPDGFASIRKGEVWRLVTPMFLHGSTLHLLFNMMWIYMLGSMLERLHGSLFFGFLLLFTQICGMLLQVLLPESLPEPLRGSPFAIGASGAVYGLFGFLWIRPYFDRTYPIRIPSSTVAMMIGWLFLCMFIVPGIANGAHVGGLLSGMAVAAAWKMPIRH